MDYTDGYIYVDYNHAESAADDLITETRSIETILQNLEMELAELKNSWIGDDKDVYNEVQTKWDTAVENIKVLLANHSGLLTDISSNYRQTEQNISQRWGDIRIGGR
ncbi:MULTISPECIES: WXG100 family type VII secretion target [Streptomyces]|uniref:WXG100 family type VII secretion target n=1 Tax=Streptomyces TaxID=1883 RepID=UPI00200DECA2|nr:WXG100 family type VII secretion target [Streptomyces sp. LRE541]UPZ29287.1 WXG100 family type VII secretion target [Streptomyces sp. LRE541]